MKIIYNIALGAYRLLVNIASPFNPKAAKMLVGRNAVWEKIKNKDFEGCYWFHAPSLGEFEQGRPVIEALKSIKPDIKIVVTFFSPSGYDIRKNYEKADLVCYLPFDSAKNAKKFIQYIKPSKAIFIKYDIWYHYLNELQKQEIPSYLISAIFRPNQIFFKGYGKWYRKALKMYTQIFVQDEMSSELLHKFDSENVTIAGDTRFDRVTQIVENAKPIAEIERFKAQNKVVVIGSSWPKDEEILTQYIHESGKDIKFIIAPHEIHESHISAICKALEVPFQRWTSLDETKLEESKVLIIDTIGMLSSLYRYGEFAYIGGGFGVGIHNTLEAATYGIPVVFGPNYHKFKEAKDLVSNNGAFTVTDFSSLKNIFDNLLNNAELLHDSGEKAKGYVQKQKGATKIILKEIA